MEFAEMKGRNDFRRHFADVLEKANTSMLLPPGILDQLCAVENDLEHEFMMGARAIKKRRREIKNLESVIHCIPPRFFSERLDMYALMERIQLEMEDIEMESLLELEAIWERLVKIEKAIDHHKGVI